MKRITPTENRIFFTRKYPPFIWKTELEFNLETSTFNEINENVQINNSQLNDLFKYLLTREML